MVNEDMINDIAGSIWFFSCMGIVLRAGHIESTISANSVNLLN